MKPGITLKNKRANQENWFTPSHHKYDPITYPNIAPKIEPNEHINAKRNAFALNPRAKGIKRTSGGIGKKDDSAKAINPSIKGPYLEFDHFKTQSYSFLNQIIFYCMVFLIVNDNESYLKFNVSDITTFHSPVFSGVRFM